MKSFKEYAEEKNEGVLNQVGGAIASGVGHVANAVANWSQNRELHKPIQDSIVAMQNVAKLVQSNKQIADFIQQSGKPELQQMAGNLTNMAKTLANLQQQLPKWGTAQTLNTTTQQGVVSPTGVQMTQPPQATTAAAPQNTATKTV